jgi:uridylate kinase
MNESSKPKWRRVLLKVSGEALAGDQTQNIDPKVCVSVSKILVFYQIINHQVSLFLQFNP